jgi:REP element-mobilizing transposase RayT
MSPTPGHGHEALRRGRWSAPGAEYFLTLCTHGRQHGLTEPPLSSMIFDQAHQLTAKGDWFLRTAVIMPDHLHLLLTLDRSSELSKIVRLFKGRLTPVLRTANLRWQRAYFDHRLRADEDRLPLFLYIFLNPYQARLVRPDQAPANYFCAKDDWSWFGPLTNSSCPLPDWPKVGAALRRDSLC